MNKQQLIVIASAAALFFTLYFGCDVKNREQKAIETNRVLAPVTLDIKDRIEHALESLAPAQKADIQALTEKIEKGGPSVLKQLSGAWHNNGHDEIAAHYAEEVAKKENTDEAWSIAGANYYLGIQQSEDKDVRDFCRDKAVDAFQSAASLNPTKLEHRINLALCYTENPVQDNPMKGILMLRELDTQNPENVAVNVQLARLAIKTGQYDKAVGRLEKIIVKETNNPKVICLLAEAYEGAKNPKAGEMKAKCQAGK
jgi:thioredoxin-like negative regulator of GroEL